MSIAAGSRITATSTRPASWFYAALVVLGGIMAVIFWFVAATPYFTLQREILRPGTRRLLAAAVPAAGSTSRGGSLALLLGPINLWLGETRRRLALAQEAWASATWRAWQSAQRPRSICRSRRRLAGCSGAALFTLAVVWTITTGMAFLAISRRAIVQHREWMIRSYVVTLAFVFFRIVLRSPSRSRSAQ